MANYSNLKTAIENAVDWNNGDNEITGQNLLDILETIIDSLGAKYKFADVATPSSSITTPDEPLFYLAGAGTYTNFSGLSVTIPRGTLAIFYYDTAWHYTTVRTDSDAFFNVNQHQGTPSTTYTKANARNAVPEALRSKGMIITYLTTNGWIIEQNLSTSGTWNADANWQTIGPVSVSQNTETGHTDIIIKDKTTEVARSSETEAIGLKAIPTTFTLNYRIETDGKLVTRTDNYSYVSDFVAVTPQQVLWYCGNRPSTSFLAIAGYSSNDENTFVSSLDNTRYNTNEPKRITIPNGVHYIRIAYIEMYGVGGLWEMAGSNSMLNEGGRIFAKYPAWCYYVNFDNQLKKATINGDFRARIRISTETSNYIEVSGGTEIEYPNSFAGYMSLIVKDDGTLSFVSSGSADLNKSVVLVTFLTFDNKVRKTNICDSLVRVTIDEENMWEDGALTPLTLNQYATWEKNYRLGADGTKISGDGKISNFIPVTEGQRYYYRASCSNPLNNIDIAGYSTNEEGSFIANAIHVGEAGGAAALALKSVVIPSGVHYVRIGQIGSYPSEYGFWEIPTGGLLEASVKTFIPQTIGNAGVLLENQVASNYLHNTDYSNNPEYTITDITNYYNIPTLYQKSRPAPVSVKWDILENTTAQRLEVSDNLFFTEVWSYALGAAISSFDIYNLIPNKRYYWRVYATISGIEVLAANGSFDVFGRCRMLYIDGEGTFNYRDLGGWKLPNNKHIRYGRLIRGAENYRPDEGIEISQTGIDMLVNYLGINVELDFGDIWQDTALPNTVEFLHGADIYGFMGYDRPDGGLSVASGRLKYYNSLHAVISRLADGKNIYFHCNAGADRTGTFAFLIEALLGVSESDLSKDYELTSFYTLRQRNVNAGGDYGYPSMIAWIKANYNGDTLQEKVYDLCTRTTENNGIGLTQEEITTLRNIMIEDD